MSSSTFPLRILLVEPFFLGSHRDWALSWRERSIHHIEILTLPCSSWKQKMKVGALNLAAMCNEECDIPDLILGSDMLDLPTFLCCLPKSFRVVPTVLYFHENQFAYPCSPYDQEVRRREYLHYALLNLKSAAGSDCCLFNSYWNLDSFLAGARQYFDEHPDAYPSELLSLIREKSKVLPVGIDLAGLTLSMGGASGQSAVPSVPTIVWNHRWEFDKNPAAFFRLLAEISAEGHEFELIVLGEQPDVQPEIFRLARESLRKHIVHWGYAESREEYARLLTRGNILPVTANQEFFGVSVVEAIACGCTPFLPRRLSYPELIPEALHDQLLYDSYSDLKVKVRDSILAERKHDSRLDAAVARYDWSQMAERYDNEMIRIFEAHSRGELSSH